MNSTMWPMLNIFKCMNSAATVIFVSCIVTSRDFTIHALKKKKPKTLKLKRAIQMDTKYPFGFKLLWRLRFCYAGFSFFFFCSAYVCWLFHGEQCIHALFTDLQILLFSIATVIFVSCIVASRDFTVHALKKKKTQNAETKTCNSNGY